MVAREQASKGETSGLRAKLRYYIYNVCDHQECYREVGSQAVACTTGVPAMLGAKMVASGAWRGAGVFNVEQFDPDPFMHEIGRWGLPWQERFLDAYPL